MENPNVQPEDNVNNNDGNDAFFDANNRAAAGGADANVAPAGAVDPGQQAVALEVILRQMAQQQESLQQQSQFFRDQKERQNARED